MGVEVLGIGIRVGKGWGRIGLLIYRKGFLDLGGEIVPEILGMGEFYIGRELGVGEFFVGDFGEYSLYFLLWFSSQCGSIPRR